ncbi:DNA-binding SARP family transcriptional activator [Saccharothrix tamanrassetensis]|uniref:DNA-binding SARP family transcriptional activator n=1 Tax=Saccharothrix tamanrassetensis TaxID=1051531 RepID=A0A841CM47_9PSEU|nr:BTAD domain-containing putative transcriptional regulator [Saccharothrix tamanrassetensis]MBB5957444.1 DNA-binding SARP family transcriptional activator [Saccharothrix tamanrassetensis]
MTPTAPKLRQVMAVLSVSANRLIRTDQLIDELWPERPPASAMTTLQTYVYKLRKLMLLGNPSAGPARETAVALTTRPSGYLLRLPDHAVDAGQFEELAHRGRTELAADRVDSAASVLRDALEVWRGPALTDVPAGPLLRSEIVRLEERRKSTLELRVAADLRLGRYHDLIGELTNLVAGEPTHEGFQGKLMLALHLAGRRSDALRVYQSARESLAGELGLEPSAELQRLQRRILDSDGTLESSFQRSSARAGAIEPPAQLPPKVSGLIGRDRPAGELHDLLCKRLPTGVPPVLVVTGPPGVGSSALCLQAAHQARESYPDGQFYAKLTAPGSGPVQVDDVLAAFLRGTGTSHHGLPDDLKERSGLFRSWTARRRVLVVLDDVVDTDQLAHLLPSGPDCATLVATRRRIHHPSVSRTVDLAPLDDADALALLVRELGSPRVRRQLADARRLAEFCGGLPLALRAAATVLRVRSHWPIAHLLRQEKPATWLGVAASVRTTCDLLPADVRATLRVLAPTATAPLTPVDAAALLGADAHAAESALECLVEHHLADVVPTDAGDFQYRIPPLVRLGLRDLGAPPLADGDPSVRKFA